LEIFVLESFAHQNFVVAAFDYGKFVGFIVAFHCEVSGILGAHVETVSYPDVHSEIYLWLVLVDGVVPV
jgi:hypothetical protein